MEPFEIFPLKITRPLALIAFVGLPRWGSATRLLFNYLYRNAISAAFLTAGSAGETGRSLVLGIDLEQMEKCRGELEVLKSALGAEKVLVEEPVAVIRILGPHFDIRPGIAGLLFAGLMQGGVRLLANSTTITSSLLVVPEEQVEKTLRVLRSIFRLPESKSRRN
jgi:aspartokinase